jgi:hypothetical protein
MLQIYVRADTEADAVRLSVDVFVQVYSSQPAKVGFIVHGVTEIKPNGGQP